MHYIGQEEIEAVTQVINNKQFMRYRGGEGGFTEQFEQALCEKTGVKHSLTLNSGTSALIAALAGLGIGPGDEVIVPAYTWVATALAPLAVGAVPILADIDESLTIDVEDIKRKITPYTKAIIPVHMMNLACDMDAIMALADERGLKVIEDACQGVCGMYKEKRLGSIGDVGVYSFNMFKNMTCGEGGALLTDDDQIYQRALIYHDTGAYTRNYASTISIPFFAGVNYRVSEIHGALLGVQLKRVDGFLQGLRERRALAAGILKTSGSFKVSPHHDPDSAAALSIVFDETETAVRFEEEYKVARQIQSGRHVYSNWEPIMKQQVFHEKMNPYKWANREITYSPDMCPRTLDILERSCAIGFGYDTPMDDVAKSMEKLAAWSA